MYLNIGSLGRWYGALGVYWLNFLLVDLAYKNVGVRSPLVSNLVNMLATIIICKLEAHLG